MNTNWLKTRQTKYGAYVAVYTDRDHRRARRRPTGSPTATTSRIDTTANKQFSLSDQTKKVVQNLKHDVNINYFDRDSRTSRRPRDLLDRYNNLSPKLHVDYIDPEKKPQSPRPPASAAYVTIAGR